MEPKRRWPFEVWGVECGIGWKKLVDPLLLQCELENIEVQQVKEKFGGLRFYVREAPDALQTDIDQAELLSYHTCEFCGEPGKLRPGSWIKVRCNKCQEEHLAGA